MQGATSSNERTRLPRTSRRPRRGPATGADCRDGLTPTLEDSILGTLALVGAHGEATCPVCAGPELTGAGCRSCGSVLEA